MGLKAYAKIAWPTALLYALIFCLLWICFALYRLPLLAVAYPMGLGLALLACYFVWDFGRERRRFARQKALEAQLAEVRQELTAAQEKTAQRMEYYSVWAHQIKTPIAAMGLKLQESDTALSRSLQYDLNHIESYAEMVLTYLRLDSSSTDYVLRRQDLDKIIRGAVRKFSGEFIARKIRLDYTPVEINVLTDEKWLSFVIEQVLSNALKYTPSGSVAIYLEPPKTLCIRDTGIGIAPEDLPRIFDQGYTGYNGRRDKRASGIGLYLCRRICAGLGHGISAQSEVGAGTVIRLNLQEETVEMN